MAHPLELSYNWRTPVIVTSVALVVCCGILLGAHATGRLSAIAALIALWALFMGVVYLRTRAYLMVDGRTLRLRRYRAFADVVGEDVISVRQFLTPSGPSYALTVRTETGTRKLVAPTALLRGGHSTLFRWLTAAAPQAELDKASRKTLDLLRVRGLVE